MKRGGGTEPQSTIIRALVALLLAASPAAGQGQAPAPGPTVAPAAQPRAAVFAVHVAQGLDPSLGGLVGQQLRKTAARVGYALVDERTTSEAASRFGAMGALSPERARELTSATGARVGLFASVSAAGGRYRVSVQAVPGDGGPARTADAIGVSSDLWSEMERVVGPLIPPSAPMPAPSTSPSTIPLTGPSTSTSFPEGSWRFAVGSAVAWGVYNGEFRNHLLGGRIDRRFSDVASLGLAVQYANLKGKQGRAHNVLPWALFEYRIELEGGWAIPLRYATGYLPNNGPVVHGAAGVSMPLGDSVDLTLELAAPTVWIVQERAVLSLDLGAEIAFSL